MKCLPRSCKKVAGTSGGARGGDGSEQLVNYPAVIDDRHRPALGSAELLARVDPQLMEHRRVEVFRPERRRGRLLGAGIALAEDATALDAAAGDQHSKGRPPMIAAGVLVDARRSAELAGH